jgi:glutamate synthase domain-containing protein 2
MSAFRRSRPPPAVKALQDLGMHRKVQLIVSGGIRNGADVAKALALGADAVSIGTAALVALGDNDPALRGGIQSSAPRPALRRLARGPRPGRHHHAGPGAAGAPRSGAAGRRLSNYLAVLTLEAQTIARACGKSHVHNLEPEDLWSR